MNSNLTDEYLDFIKENQHDPHLILEIVQDTIDKMQYSAGFLENFLKFLNSYESPFEVSTETNGGTIRRLKPNYINSNK